MPFIPLSARQVSLAPQYPRSKTHKEAWYCTPLLQSEVVGLPYNADMETAHAVGASRHTVSHYNSEISYVSDCKNEHNASLYSINCWLGHTSKPTAKIQKILIYKCHEKKR